ncbi:hypothetical protein, partial [Fischerella muscicola]|uniref:hypothetical protein n=1 Tax=Fischerella muscicola TaxID=92938 RepID=UPI001CA4C47C
GGPAEGRREELFGQLYFRLHTTLREVAARLRFFCAVLLSYSLSIKLIRLGCHWSFVNGH